MAKVRTTIAKKMVNHGLIPEKATPSFHKEDASAGCARSEDQTFDVGWDEFPERLVWWVWKRTSSRCLSG